MIKDFKIKVNPQESEIVQKLLFLNGSTWSDGDDFLCRTNEPYLIVFHGLMYYSNDIDRFNTLPMREITFEEFLNEIEIELQNNNTKV